MKKHLPKDQVDGLLQDMGFGDDTRTEQLSVDTLLMLTERLRQLAPEWKL